MTEFDEGEFSDDPFLCPNHHVPMVSVLLGEDEDQKCPICGFKWKEEIPPLVRPWKGCCGQCVDQDECEARRAEAEKE